MAICYCITMLEMEKVYDIGEAFQVQFVWQIPDEGDFLRAVFTAEVLGHEPGSDKYKVRLTALMGGRQETAEGQMQPAEALTRDYWAIINDLVGQEVFLAYEAADGRPLPLRFTTLTGEHDFFHRFESSIKSGPNTEPERS